MTASRIALALVLATSTLAHADEPSPLGQAKLAFDQVRFDDAQRLLIGALEEGHHQPLAMREIYKLLGASAVALGNTDDAEKYYRVWISIDPKATLDAGTSPKVRKPFDAAKSYVAANGPLDVSATRVSDLEIRVRVVSDPLALARSARMRDNGAPAAIVDRGAVLSGAGPVFVLDRYGNTLVEVAATSTPTGTPPSNSTPPNDTTSTGTMPPPVYTRDIAGPVVKPSRSTAFYVLAVPTGILLAAGVGFGAASIVYNANVQTALEDSGAHYYDDVVDDQKRVTQFWKLSAVIGGAGLVLAIPTTILYLRDRRATMVMPYADGDSAGAAVFGRF